jgi:predicted alpha/beta superfamily hydrolase
MKSIVVVLILILSLCLSAQEMFVRKINFVVITDSLSEKDTVFITGNDSQLGFWNPGKIKLEKRTGNRWEKEFDFQVGKHIEYKFTLGSWDREALNEERKIPGNHLLEINNDTLITYKISGWATGSHSFKGQITGTVQYIRNMEGEGLKPRDIIVWLPPGYDKNNTKRYPVLYMHDGQNIIDPSTSFSSVDWQIDETADSLIKQHKMREIIIVGIYNTVDRSSEYSYSDTGYAYMNFILDRLKPFIDLKYRTLRDRDNTATMGSSLGGLISFMLVWEHPEVFSMAGCLSPAIKIDSIDYLSKIKTYKGKKKPVKFYFDVGGVGGEKRLQPGLNETIEVLKEKGYIPNKDFEVYVDENASHNEAAWAKRVWRPLMFMFGKIKI